MATRTFYAIKDMKHPTYRTRMLRAGDELELDGPTARLFTRLGVITPDKPKRPATGNTISVNAAPAAQVTIDPTPVKTTAPAVAPKAAPRKRTKKRATAKK
jgi:hypothetical protein